MNAATASLWDAAPPASPATPAAPATTEEAQPCQECQKRNGRPGGAYRLQCLACCTDLVLSAYPLRHHAASMLAAIERQPGSPGRARVSESVRQTLASSPSPGRR